VLERLALEKSGAKQIGDIARELGVSRRTLERRFHARLGMSPAHYRIRQRIDRARALMASGMTRATALRLCGVNRHQGI
jgi:transcriptional regulator GlxA family with amidase domain